MEVVINYRNKYEDETGVFHLSVENGYVTGYYTNEYVYWLEQQLEKAESDSQGGLDVDEELKMFFSEIEEERQAKGWTKKYLSERIFNSQCTYFNILSGHRTPNYRTLKKLANGVGLKLIICLGDDID